MKKLFTVFLSLLYLVLSTGFTQYSHICKETSLKQFSFTNIQDHSSKPCPICLAKEKGLKKKKKNCCKYESHLIKVDDGVKKQSIFDLCPKSWADGSPNLITGTVFDFSIEEIGLKSFHFLSSKVPIRDTPLYILHCVYRI